MASGIIDALYTSSKSCAVAYYFCDYVDKRTLDPAAILRTIAQQLLENREMPLAIEKLITANCGNHRSADLLGSLSILVAAIRTYPAVAIVLDGTDEMEEESQKALLSALNMLASDADLTLKLLISCRDDSSRVLKFPTMMTFRVHIQPSSLALDIEDYISHTIDSLLMDSKLVVQDPVLKEIIIEKLVKGAQGM